VLSCPSVAKKNPDKLIHDTSADGGQGAAPATDSFFGDLAAPSRDKPAAAPAQATRGSTRTEPKPVNAANHVGYTVLARRYRSRGFDELIGQEPIAQTLRNAIATGRTAHAYLFCGTRGVGKTSMARIFATALNVTDELTEKDAIAAAILRGDDLDVIEIDAASNRGIDEARNLIAGAGLSPSRCRYKIFIIDEVHMLTTPAFNALLKTMEEPPAHVKFILCTTEVHKVPDTIQSRCQRFDFRPISTPRIMEQLRLILGREGIAADDEVIGQVARLGHGSMRDALSVLDRVLAAGISPLTPQGVASILGLPEQTLIMGAVDAVIAADAAAALCAGGELLARGSSVEQALESLVEHLRNLMVASACGSDSELLDLSGESRAVVARQAAHFDAAGLVYMIALCEAAGRNARGSAISRAIFDAVLARLALTESVASIPALLSGQGAQGGSAPSAGEKKNAGERREALSAPQHPPAPGPRQAMPEQAPLVETIPARPVAARVDDAASSPATAAAAVATDDRPLWQRLHEACASEADRAKLADLSLHQDDGDVITLRIAEHAAPRAGFLRAQSAWYAALVRRVTRRGVRIEFIESGGSADAGLPRERIVEEVLRLPAVVRAMELFDATVMDVALQEAGAPRGEA
jgi:DNA polymerase III subunit gamma/tau